MAKNFYVGISNKARKIKKAYVGISGQARKIKKIYIGISNVARCFFSGEPLSTIDMPAPSVAHIKAATGNILTESYYDSGSYMYYSSFLFIGGGYSGISSSGSPTNLTNVVDIYNVYLQRMTPQTLTLTSETKAASLGTAYVLFSFEGDTKIDAFNPALVKSAPTVRPNANTRYAAIGNPDYAMFAGGLLNGSCLDAVVTYNKKSLTRSSATNLITPAYYVGAAGDTGGYTIFAGGISSGSSPINTTNAYSSSLTRTTPATLPSPANRLTGVDLAGYRLFVGGYLNSNNYNTTVVAYHGSSLTRVTLPETSVVRSADSFTVSGAKRTFSNKPYEEYCMIIGGKGSSSSPVLDVVDVYDKSLTHSLLTLPTKVLYGAGGKIRQFVPGSGQYNQLAVYAGGASYDSTTRKYSIDTTVKAYTVES